MKISSTQQGGVCVISIAGSIDALTSGDAEKFLDEQIEKGEERLVVDLSQVDYLSSAGLRVLMATLRSVRQRKGDMYLTSPQDHIQQLLAMAGFTRIFKIFSASSEAIDAFAS